MIDGMFALQTSSDTVPDFVTANIDFFSKYVLVMNILLISIIINLLSRQSIQSLTMSNRPTKHRPTMGLHKAVPVVFKLSYFT